MVKNRRFSESEHGLRLGIRHLQCFLLFIGLSVAYALRVNLSVAIVAMTDRNATNPEFEEYDWDEKTKAFILSSFFWGYVVTQFPAGQIAHHYGAKFLFLTGISICSVLTILTPWCASIGGWKLVCGSRFVQGLCQGVAYPCTHAVLSKWAPANERGRLNTICYSGCQFGTVGMMAVCGIIASSSLGWPAIYYISGGVGIMWSAAWLFFGASSPANHKSISPEERAFIENSIDEKKDGADQIHRTPWREIFTSVPFMALTFVQCCHVWGFWTLLTEIPSYMNHVLGMDINSNALLSALPYAVMWLLSYVFCVASDILTKKKWVSLKLNRYLFNTIGLWIPAAALVGMGYATSKTVNLAVGLLIVAVGVNSSVYLGYLVNHIDLSPNYAGTLMGISNGIANIMSLLGPLAVGLIVENERDAAQWRIVFFISAGAYFIGNVVWCAFGSTEVQPWNSPKSSTNKELNGNNQALKEIEQPV